MYYVHLDVKNDHQGTVRDNRFRNKQILSAEMLIRELLATDILNVNVAPLLYSVRSKSKSAKNI